MCVGVQHGCVVHVRLDTMKSFKAPVAPLNVFQAAAEQGIQLPNRLEKDTFTLKLFAVMPLPPCSLVAEPLSKPEPLRGRLITWGDVAPFK